MPSRNNHLLQSETKDQAFTGEPDDKKLIIQMHKPMWEELRHLAFNRNISMAELCRQGISILLEQCRKDGDSKK